ncbi:MAG: PKD domain-containing protein [Nanoarchaeota archaeon]|mgnify:FL=1
MKKEVIFTLVILFFLLFLVNVYAENTAPVANAGDDRRVLSGSMVVLDGSKSYDNENNLPVSDLNYIWYEDDKEIGRGIKFKDVFTTGKRKLTLKVIDTEGLSSTDDVTVSVISRNKCQNTNTKYAPEDSVCNKKWPSQEGEILIINSKGYSCDLVEVCSDDLDYIVEDSLDCCDGTPLSNDQSRVNACNFANKYSNQDTKKCQALYLVQSLGGNSIYMKDYFELEMCCKGVKELCSNPQNLYSSNPLPKIGKDLSSLRCNNNPDNNPPGEWVSDTKLDLNNIALQDVPTHVSLNVLSTGTCVDYSFSLTTLLRKLGYKKDEVYSVESDDHAYNLLKLPLNKKYTIVDTTGNNDPAIIFGKIPLGYDYCENIKKCYNDNGEALCPPYQEIYGCENVKQSIGQKADAIGFKINKVIDNVVDLVKVELER